MLTIYKASAGSGKTFNLAFEYIKLMLCEKQADGSYVLAKQPQGRQRHILAITFTNKATAEMKERIIKELWKMSTIDTKSNKNDSKFVELMLSEIGCSREALRRSAALGLDSLLSDYRYFHVSTIDSFFQTILREFAREVDTQGDFDLSLDDREVMEESLGMMFDDINCGDKENLARFIDLMTHLVIEKVAEKGISNPFDPGSGEYGSLVNFMLRICDENFKSSADDMKRYLADSTKFDTFRKRLLAQANQAAAHDSLSKKINDFFIDFANAGYQTSVINSTLLRDLEIMSEPGKSIPPAHLPSNDKLPKILVAVRDYVPGLSDPSPFYVKSRLPKRGSAPIYPEICFADRISSLFKDIFHTTVLAETLKSLYEDSAGIDMINYAWDYTRKFRAENNRLLLSDAGALINKIINGSDVPFIYERLGITLRHFLIDEFQDTSRMQWDNLKPLVENGIAYGNDSLIIGDEKQAIYRFRNSDSSMLHSTVAEVDFPQYEIEIKGNDPSQNTNYRSAHGIVDFNNSLFPLLANQLNINTYGNVIQSKAEATAELSHYIKFTDTGKSATKPLEVMGEEIKRQLSDGYRPCEIAVLTRTRKEGVAAAEYILDELSLKVISEDALLLSKSPAVKIIIGVLRILDSDMAQKDPDNEESSSPYGSEKEFELMKARYEYALSRGYSCADALKLSCGESEPEEKYLEGIREISDKYPADLPSLVEAIVNRMLSDEMKRQQISYITAFEDEVMEYCRCNIASLTRFLAWWDSHSGKLSIQPSQVSDAITVITVHQAKGLQWPCVHIPFGSFELYKDNVTMWLDPAGIVPDVEAPPLLLARLGKIHGQEGSPVRDIYLKNIHDQTEDNLNTLYVAFTRPKNELTVCFDSTKNVGKFFFGKDEIICMESDSDSESGEEEAKVVFESGAPTLGDTVEIQDDNKRDFIYNIYYRDDLSAMVTLPESEAPGEDISDGLEPDNLADAIQTGQLYHSILACVKTPSQLKEAVYRVCRRENKNDTTAENCLSLLQDAFDKASVYVERWFAPDARILAEQSIFAPSYPVTIRPDRLVFHPDGSLEIVDYKFTSSLKPEHFSQMRNYVIHMRAMGFDSARGFLWNPFLKKVEEVKV